jgi:hypothetical protein
VLEIEDRKRTSGGRATRCAQTDGFDDKCRYVAIRGLMVIKIPEKKRRKGKKNKKNEGMNKKKKKRGYLKRQKSPNGN